MSRVYVRDLNLNLAKLRLRLWNSGLSLAQISREYGLESNTLAEHFRQAGIVLLNPEYVYASELAAELGVRDTGNLVDAMRALGFGRKFGGRWVCRAKHEAEVVRAYFKAQVSPSDAGNWYTAREAAAKLGLTYQQFLKHRRKKRIKVDGRRVKGGGPNGGWNWVYKPSDVLALAGTTPIQGPRRPHGKLATSALADLIGSCHSTVQKWILAGCPHTRNGLGEGLLVPFQVAKWLEARPLHTTNRINVQRRRYIEILRAWTPEQRAA